MYLFIMHVCMDLIGVVGSWAISQRGLCEASSRAVWVAVEGEQVGGKGMGLRGIRARGAEGSGIPEDASGDGSQVWLVGGRSRMVGGVVALMGGILCLL